MSDRRKSFRASQMAQLLSCPGSARLIARVNPSGDSSASLVGTWCHWEGGRRLVQNHGALAPESALVEPKMPEGWKASGFELWMIDFYLQTVLTYADFDMALLVEQEFAHSFARFDLTGHIDNFAINADATEAVGGDLKTGIEVVDEAEQNAQVLTYIVLLLLAYPTLRKITFFICQPRNDEDMGNPRVSFVTIEGEHLAGLISYLEREVNYALDHEDDLNSDGFKQCKYCPAAEQCPAYDADFQDMKMKLTEEYLATVTAEPSLERLVDLEIDRKKFMPMLTRAHDALKERVKAAGNEVHVGPARVWVEEKNGTRTITNNPEVTALLQDLPDDEFHTTYQFKPEPIEKALARLESARTGVKVPHDSTVKGKTSGKSLFRDRIGAYVQQGTVEHLKIAV